MKVRYNYGLKGLARDLRRNSTPAEKRLWYLLKALSQPFRRQRPIGSYIVDFYCTSAKLVIEVDGESHFTPGGLEQEAARTAYLEGLGLQVLRFTNHEVLANAEGVFAVVEQTLASRKF